VVRDGNRELSQSDANACRALCDRGYVDWMIEVYSYIATDAGRRALEQEKGE